MELRETTQRFSKAFSDVYKADFHRLKPMVEAQQQVNQKAALAFTPKATRSVLEGVNPHRSAGPDGVHTSLAKILAYELVEPFAALFNRTLVDGIPVD